MNDDFSLSAQRTNKHPISIYADCFSIYDIHKLVSLMSMLLPIFVLPLLGLLSGVKAHLKLLALVSQYSGNPNVRYDIVFSLGPIYINKSQFCYPYFLLTSKGDFGVKAPPQTCQQSIFGILVAPQNNQWGQTFWPS